MSSDERTSQPPPRRSPHPSPLALDYESPPGQEVTARRGVRICGTLLVIGWVPYLCGVLNGLVVRRYPYSPEIVKAHAHSSIAFMMIGAALSMIALVALVRMRYFGGAMIAAGVLIAQASIALCLNLH